MQTQSTKLVYHIAASVDHYIAGEGGSYEGFVWEGPHVDDFLQSLYHYGAILMGKNTYEAGYEHGLEPGQPSYPFTNLTNYIFSKSLAEFETPHEQVKIVRDDPATVVADLKTQIEKPLWLCGGGALAGYLLDHQLIDELILKLNPSVFGSGIPLFGGSRSRANMTLIDSKTYCSGVMTLRYSLHYDG